MKKKILAVICMLTMIIGLVGCQKSFDATGYVKGYLDSNMLGEFDAYAKLCQEDVSEVQKIYDEGVDTVLASWTTGLTLDDEMKEKYRQLVIDTMKKAKYTVNEAKKDGNDYKVEVVAEPMKLNMSAEDAKKVGEDAATEYQKTHKKVDQTEFLAFLSEKYYDFLSDAVANITYEDSQTIEVTVTKNSDKKYTLSTEDQSKLSTALFAQ